MHGSTTQGVAGRAPDGQEDGKGLPDGVVQAKLADGVDVDLIHLLGSTATRE